MKKNGMLSPKNSPCEYCGERSDFIADGGIATCSACSEFMSEEPVSTKRAGKKLNKSKYSQTDDINDALRG